MTIEPTIITVTAAVIAGAAAWTLLEYGLHRYAMHELRGKGLASREHLKHHADVTYFASTAKKVLSAATTTVIVWPVAWLLTGPAIATAFTVGLIGMYSYYELAHRRIHTHAPRTAYGRWRSRSHFHHHFGGPMRNFGVMVNIWDRATGTYDEPGVITVPRRHAPVWMTDEHGEIKPEFAADYVIKGRRDARVTDAERQRDHEDAFANRVPLLEVSEAPDAMMDA